ncbi:hypothetical protein B0J12DRAFT_306136 [Macrophomina phaseolina]|uniref:Uncharacterized protein n=1 Tax=Macrophomina phaseolina TaxID=35725 RepID=A0ABQ8FYC0_9PEZI|nr:hypothetical protein B0J12DRAFT_306136 [Macrophomina phaseolina]
MSGTWARGREIMALRVDAKLGLKPPSPVAKPSGESLASANLQPSLDARHRALLLSLLSQISSRAEPGPPCWTAAVAAPGRLAHGLPRAALLFGRARARLSGMQAGRRAVMWPGRKGGRVGVEVQLASTILRAGGSAGKASALPRFRLPRRALLYLLTINARKAAVWGWKQNTGDEGSVSRAPDSLSSTSRSCTRCVRSRMRRGWRTSRQIAAIAPRWC